MELPEIVELLLVWLISALFFWWIYKKSRNVFRTEKISAKTPWFKKPTAVIVFNCLVILLSFMVCAIILLTATFHNFYLASQGELPGITPAAFYAIFPGFEANLALSLEFPNFIPIGRTMVLVYCMIFFVFELLFEAKHYPGVADLPPHAIYVNRFLRLGNPPKRVFLKILVFLVILLVAIPTIIYLVFKSPLFDPTFQALIDEYYTVIVIMIVPVEITLGVYLASFSIRYLFEDFRAWRHPEQESNPKQMKKQFFPLASVIFVILIINNFVNVLSVLANYTPQNAQSGGNLFLNIIAYLVPEGDIRNFLQIIFTLFPIDMILFLSIQLLFFFRLFFKEKLSQSGSHRLNNMFFLSFLAAGYASFFGWNFMVSYPWLYASNFSGSRNYADSLIMSYAYFPFVIITSIADFVCLLYFLYRAIAQKKAQKMALPS